MRTTLIALSLIPVLCCAQNSLIARPGGAWIRPLSAQEHAQATIDSATASNAAANEAIRAAAPALLPNGITINDATTGEPVSLTVADGDVVTYSGATNKSGAVSARHAIRQQVRDVRTNTVALIDESTNRISQASTIVGDVSGIAVSPSSTTAQVRSALVDLKDATTDLAVHTREMDRALRDTQRELRAMAAALAQYLQPTNAP